MAALSLITGFPGFIGKRLVARLLRDDPELRLVALVEPRMLEQARAAAGELEGGDRVELLAGDIAERRLGLSDSDFERLRAEITSVFHLAAIYNLAVPLEIAQRVNVEGTGNVLELCVRAERLERLNYVSTAYVAGLRTGVVYEHELSLGQGFKNHYESTKFQAEVWVREEMARVPTTIYRPAIVVGDSRTGETQKFDGPYYMLRAISVAVRRNMPIAQFGRASAPFNCVPVDFIVDAIAVGSTDPELVGRTLHLVDPQPVTAAEVFDILAREYAGRGPSYRVPAKLVEGALRLRGVREMFRGAPQEAIRYLSHPVRFDTRNAEDFLARHGMRCPRVHEYAGPMVRFFREHEHDERFVAA
ncbi:MAG: SDR family oxidoreductase [Thermoleophilaceae bacterium]|nr:SDR family oxidoreductase [Thermoleophilaceae bacterium]